MVHRIVHGGPPTAAAAVDDAVLVDLQALRPGGSYLSQQVGRGSVRELTDALMGPQPVSEVRSPERARAGAVAAGLTVSDLRVESLAMSFADVAAVVHFLRKVIWIVPGFTVERYRDRVVALHEQIRREGPFRATSERFLIEAHKPAEVPSAARVR